MEQLLKVVIPKPKEDIGAKSQQRYPSLISRLFKLQATLQRVTCLYIKGIFCNKKNCRNNFTGKSFSEALILASVNPQYDKRLFIEFFFSGNSMNNLSSYCGLTDSRMRASDKDLSVCFQIWISR